MGPAGPVRTDHRLGRDRRAGQFDHSDRHLHTVWRRRELAGRLHRIGAVRRFGVLRLRQLCRGDTHARLSRQRSRGAGVRRAFLAAAGRGDRADHPASARIVFLLADAGIFADRLRDRLQVDRPHRRRKRPAGRAAPLAGQRLVIPCLHCDHRDGSDVAAVAHCAFAVRPGAAGTARQRAAHAKPWLFHLPPEVRGVRHPGRHGRLCRRTAGVDAARCLRR